MNQSVDRFAEQLARCDIRYFAIFFKNCPNCGECFAKMHPMQNLMPHFDGSCIYPAPCDISVDRFIENFGKDAAVPLSRWQRFLWYCGLHFRMRWLAKYLK
jgi:hypothetical protein